VRYGFVSSNLVDLWIRPKFNSERASQLLFGQPVRIVAEKGGYYSILQPDGYLGCVDRRFVELISKTAYTKYLKSLNTFVNASTARLSGGKGQSGVAPYYLYYGTRLFTRSTKNGFARIILPSKSSLLIKKSNLVPINTKNAERVTGRMLVSQARRFLGVPYLWGGVTTAGFDCSGFVQTVLARFGVSIPRDTKDQIQVGEKVERDCIKTGDLLFFERHVGLAVGRDRLIHSSAGGGGVRINSLAAGTADYREDLDRGFNQARRVTCSS
jgi:hypothetical protein